MISKYQSRVAQWACLHLQLPTWTLRCVHGDAVWRCGSELGDKKGDCDNKQRGRSVGAKRWGGRIERSMAVIATGPSSKNMESNGGECEIWGCGGVWVAEKKQLFSVFHFTSTSKILTLQDSRVVGCKGYVLARISMLVNPCRYKYIIACCDSESMLGPWPFSHRADHQSVPKVGAGGGGPALYTVA